MSPAVHAGTPLLANQPPLPIAAINQPDRDPSRLQAFSTSRVACFLNTRSVKVLAGTLIGLGIVFSPTGLGIGLALAGVGLLTASLAATVALNGTDLESIAMPVLRSCGWVVLGAASGVLTGLGATVLALPWLVAAANPAMPCCFALLTDLVTPFDRAPTQRDPALDTLPALELDPVDEMRRLQIAELVAGRFTHADGYTIQVECDVNGVSQNVQFHADQGRDYIGFYEITDTSQEWIALARGGDLTRYDLVARESVFNEQGEWRFLVHPTTRLPLTPDMILVGEDLLNVLTPASLQ